MLQKLSIMFLSSSAKIINYAFKKMVIIPKIMSSTLVSLQWYQTIQLMFQVFYHFHWLLYQKHFNLPLCDCCIRVLKPFINNGITDCYIGVSRSLTLKIVTSLQFPSCIMLFKLLIPSTADRKHTKLVIAFDNMMCILNYFYEGNTCLKKMGQV